ncbi:MAG: aspartyl protease family protein [Candidatus Paceibacterota bacterium]|jgi:hypothetical protein
MKFKYKEYGHALRPVIPLELRNEGKSFRHEVLIDSGSDHCFFDVEVGKAIGINKENSELKEVFGVGGKISIYYVHLVTLKVGDNSFDIKAGFMPNLGGSIVSYGIVGQKGFFDKFIIKFDYSKAEVEVKEKK